MPQSNAILDCSPVSAAGHVIPQSYVPISVSQFMDDLSAEENVPCHRTDNATVSGFKAYARSKMIMASFLLLVFFC